MDIHGAKLYDIVINIGNLTIEDACEIICVAARSNRYRITESPMNRNRLWKILPLRVVYRQPCNLYVTPKFWLKTEMFI
jgi:hypothetical protein